MKAPEKIYLYPSDRAGEKYEDEWGTFPWGEDYVEYTRTDAIIDKPCEWVKQKSAWSEEDRDLMYNTLSNLTELKNLYGKDYGKVGKCIDWIKSLKGRII